MNPQHAAQQQQQVVKSQHAYHEPDQQYVKTPYEHRVFPKWKYHATKPEVLVHSREEETRLGSEWTDKRPLVKHPKSEDELRQENEELKKQLAALKKS